MTCSKIPQPTADEPWRSLEPSASHPNQRVWPFLRPALRRDRVRFHPQAPGVAALQAPCPGPHTSRWQREDALPGPAAPDGSCSFLSRGHGRDRTTSSRAKPDSARPRRTGRWQASAEAGTRWSGPRKSRAATLHRDNRAGTLTHGGLPRPGPPAPAAGCLEASFPEDAVLSPTPSCPGLCCPGLPRVRCDTAPRRTPSTCLELAACRSALTCCG